MIVERGLDKQVWSVWKSRPSAIRSMHFCAKELNSLLNRKIFRLSGCASGELSFAFFDLLSHRDAIRNADQIGVVELNSRAFVAVVEQCLDSCRLKVSIDRLGRSHQLIVLDVDRRDHNVKRRD